MSPQALSPLQERRLAGLVSVDGRTYPLRSAQIRARAEGGVAAATLVQEFHNPYDEALEVEYTMPLPADGAVLGYTITMGARIIRGEIEVREKAEARYREALYQGRTAGLLEQDRADTFQQRLGNVPARTGVRVEIDVLQPLAFLAGAGAVPAEPGAGGPPLWEFRFPTVVGVRYVGAPGRVPDAGRLSPDRAVGEEGIPVRFGLGLTVADEIAGYGAVTSPSNAIVASESAEGTSVRLSEDSRLDRDLIVRWPALRPSVGVRVVEGRGLAGDDGRYALVTITPPEAPAAVQPRDLTVLLDSSGSMSGGPLELAKRVIEALLAGLGPGDRFEILSFANAPRRITQGLVNAAREAVERAVRDVRGIQAGGGTEMATAMAEALKTVREGSQRQVVLVSDGEIGFEREVIGKLRYLPAGVRVHAVGVGAAPNRSLTRFLARAGRGVALIATDEVTAAECGARLRAATARPVLTDLRFGGSAIRATAPARPRDVLAGQPLVLAVELGPEGGTLEVSGALAGSEEAWGWRIEVAPAQGTGPGLAGAAGARPRGAGEADARSAAVASSSLPSGALYGREAIADVEADAGIEDSGDGRADAAIERLAMRHRITSRRTSLVAISEVPGVDPAAPRRRERLAVELPAGVSAEGVGLFEAMPMAAWAAAPRAMALEPVALSRGMMPLLGMFREAAPSRGLVPGVVGPGGPVLAATVVRREGDELTLEIEVPEEGWVLPSGAATVRVAGRKLGKARVVPGKSTPPGPHPRGILVKLTLRMDGGAAWPESAAIEFEPLKARKAVHGHRKGERVTVCYASAPVGGESAAGSDRGGAAPGPAQGEPPRA